MTQQTYKHPETGNVLTKEQMLAVKTSCGKQRFREMGVAPAGVVVTDAMRERAAQYLPGTLADIINPLRPVAPIEEIVAADVRRKAKEAGAGKKRLKIPTGLHSALVVHSAPNPWSGARS